MVVEKKVIYDWKGYGRVAPFLLSPAYMSTYMFLLSTFNLIKLHNHEPWIVYAYENNSKLSATRSGGKRAIVKSLETRKLISQDFLVDFLHTYILLDYSSANQPFYRLLTILARILHTQ